VSGCFFEEIMARINGNPGLKDYQYVRSGTVSKSRPYSIAVEPGLCSLLKEADKDLLRKAWVIELISQGFDVPQDIRDNYQL
jgi:hypothetical protein